MTSHRTPVLLLTAREEVAELVDADPAGAAYAIERIANAEIDPAEAASRFRMAIVDADVKRALDLAVKMRAANPRIEFLAVASDPRVAVDAVKRGAFDTVMWPPADAADLWNRIATCLRKASPAEPPPERMGRYRLVRRLGMGGMAEVFLAEVTGETRAVVLKCMLPTLADDPEFVRMFEDEARISVTLAHPNIVQVIDVGRAAGRPYIAMEYVDGWDLQRIGSAVGWRFPLRIACHVVAEVARGLGHAHSRTASGLVHRDVNPPNVLVSRDGRVKLSDFGVAKVIESTTHTRAGVIKGKADYLSPEQVEGKPVDGRSDVFSLGAVLYLMLTGAHPFRGLTRLHTLQKIREAAFERPRAVRAEITEDLERTVLVALSRDREDRFETAALLDRELRAWLARNGTVTDGELAQFVSEAIEEPMEHTRVAVSSGGLTILSPPRTAETTEPRGVQAPVPLVTSAEPTRIVERTAEIERSEPTVSVAEALGEQEEEEEERTRSTTPSRPRAAPVGAIALAMASVAVIAIGIWIAGVPNDTRPELVVATRTPRPIPTETPRATPRLVVTIPIATATPTPRPTATPAAIVRVTPRPTPAATATPRVARALRRGTLSIWMAEGWASIAVDGRSLGVNAPKFGIELTEGSHRITLENAAAGFRREYDVVIVPDRETRLNVSP